MAQSHADRIDVSEMKSEKENTYNGVSNKSFEL